MDQLYDMFLLIFFFLQLLEYSFSPALSSLLEMGWLKYTVTYLLAYFDVFGFPTCLRLFAGITMQYVITSYIFTANHLWVDLVDVDKIAFVWTTLTLASGFAILRSLRSGIDKGRPVSI